jgi:Uncharacterized protein conserved in bacteria (DUF2252).
VAAQDARMPDKKAQALAQATVKAYRDFMSYLGERSPLEVWQTRMDLKAQLAGLDDANLETEILETLVKAEKKGKISREQPIVDENNQRFVDKPPFLFHTLPDGTPVGRTLTSEVRARYEATLVDERAALLKQIRAARRRLQGRRRRQRRNLLRRRPVDHGRRRGDGLAAEAGDDLGHRRPRGAAFDGKPAGQAGRGRPTRHAGGERRLPRLDAG